MAAITKDRLIFDTADAADSDNVGAYLRSSTGTLITDTGGSLDVNVTNSITATADLDGIQSGGNTDPDNVGLITHVRNATPGDTEQTFRSTGGTANADDVVAANVHGMDVNSFLMGFDGTTWDRIRATGGSLDVNVTGSTGSQIVTGDVADDAADSGSPVKIGFRAVDGALAAISATNDRADGLTDMYRRQYVNDAPNVGIATATVAMTTVEAAVPAAALAGRTRMLIQNEGPQRVYIGKTGVTASTGIELNIGGTLALEIGEDIGLFALTGSATSTLRVMELA